MEKIILPTERRAAQNYNPRLLVVYGKPKQGKSTAIASLDDNLILDLEDGYRSLSVMSIDARKLETLFATKMALEEQMKNTGKKPYKFITIDNATRLEEMCLVYAASKYRKTSMGAKFGLKRDKDGNLIIGKDGKVVTDPNADVRQLPNGAGYLYLREALKEVVHMFLSYCETLILVCHVKDRQINVDGTEQTQFSVDLAGKLADIICGEADAIGYIYREKNQTIMSFEGGGDTIREARPAHLRGKKFIIGESDEDNNLTMDLSKIFIDHGQGDTSESGC